MTPERLEQIEGIYHAARERDPGERGAFLAEACRQDDELQREVASLLAQDDADALMERPAMQVAANLLADETVTHLATGAQLGPYRIEAPLGAGGMGEVYRARDTRLGRSVAIKVCSAQFSGRFEREARAISALNHPNICTLHDVGPNYLVMELVEGETLSARLRKGALSIDMVLRYGTQIADALAAAHARGITHRDLKPGNIMIAKSGVKVLDFGLAKFTRPADAARHSETLTAEQVVGTLAYMAPEQLEGKECDARSDIFSLGLVLYEMVTGKRAFQGDSQAALMASVLRCELPPLVGVPEKLAHVVERCLNRDPDSRWHSATDVKLELEWSAIPQSASTAAVTTDAPSVKRRWLPWSVGTVGLLLAGLFAMLWLHQPAPLDLSAYRYTPFAFTQEQEDYGAWAPDGKTIAFVQGDHLMVQPSDGGGPTQLAEQVADQEIAWSADGARVYFDGPGGISAVSRAGGQPEVVLKRALFFDLSPDGKAFAAWRTLTGQDGSVRGSVWIASPPGIEPREYTPAPFAASGAFAPVHLRFSRDSRLLYLSMYTERGVEVWLLPFPAGSGSPKRLFRGVPWMAPPGASWMPDGRRLVLSAAIAPGISNGLWLADVRAESLTKLTDGSRGHSHPTVSPDGRRVLFTRQEADADLVELPLDGSPLRKLLATTQAEWSPTWSPKGDQFAYVTWRNGAYELWVRSSQGDWERPVVSAKELPSLSILAGPVFSPDGARIAFFATRRSSGTDSVVSLYVSPAAGGTPTLLMPNSWAPSWSPDGTSIAFLWTKPNGGAVLATLRVGSDQPPFEIPIVCFTRPVWSPSGEWIMCRTIMGLVLVSPADGKIKRQFPPPGTAVYAWSKDSGTIYGLGNPKGRPTLFALDVRTGVVRKVADYEPEQLFPFSPLNQSLMLSLSPDGKSFAMGSATAPQSDLWMLEGFAK